MSQSEAKVSRRAFATGVISTFTILPRHVLGGGKDVAPNSKTTLACIGTGGQGIQNVDAFLQFPEIQITSVCDVNRESGDYNSYLWGHGKERRYCGREPARRKVDEFYAKQRSDGTGKFCRAYNDFRELLAKEDVDAVMIATPDHTHAIIALEALRQRKHLYCEKPLAWSVDETRKITEAARKAGVATQLGNDGQAGAEACVTRELIAAGAIGAVRELHVSFGARFWRTALYESQPTDVQPVPDGLDWDLWLGPAAERPYHSEYHPWQWRNWWDFGTGLIGDMGCHLLSTPFKALNLGYPISIEASCTKLNSETYPQGCIIHYEFPARGEMPPLTLHWYDGGLRPPRFPEIESDTVPGGVIYVGDEGKMRGHRIIPEAKMREFGSVPRTLPRSPGHFKEFVNGCRGGELPGANIVDHAGVLSECCALGNIAVRLRQKLEWDGEKMQFVKNKKANELLQRQNVRDGWVV